ncbi:MAG: YheC/YheD family protein [Firmicutes bacterium]|nr:YheC/YheD family protein [Bacillota bacterium]
MQALGLRSGARLRAVWDSKKNRLRLGPVVAIMLWRYRSLPSFYLFGPATDMARMFVRLARARGAVAYAFSPADIHWESKSVIGYTPVGRRWRRVRMPLPDVIYDRIQSRSIDASRRVQATKQQLMAMEDLHYFNPCFLDKWETYEALIRDPVARQYLPKTERLTSLDQLGPWLRNYRTVFIKPTRGSLGMGIVKISRMARGYRYHRIRMGGGSRAGVCDSMRKLQSRLRAILPRRTMIIQQGLHLARYGGRPYDIRVMVQKTPRGNWVCTNMIARVASPGSAVSNVAEGGTMISVRRAIRGSLRINSRVAVQRIRRGARTIARAVEEQLGQEFGEFGVDMALDRRGRLWLIEVNAKPGRQNDFPGIPPSMRRVARYAVARARFYERG